MAVVTKNSVSIALACGALLLVASAPVHAQTDEYPSRPITVIVPFAPGGSSDVVMRLVSKRVSESLKQTIVIDNRPGGAGNVAALAIKNAPKDGYTLMMGHTGTHAINATLYPDLKFDPVKDFTPITPLISFNNILIVNAVSPAKSAKELVALAKTKPDGLTYASQGVGTGGHLLGVILAKQTGIKLVHVPYRGVAPAVTDMVADRVDLMFSSYVTAGPHIESGKLRMLAIAGGKRHPRLQDLPTMGEAGFPGVEMEQWFGLFGPAGLPEGVVRKLNAAFVEALKSDEVQNTLLPQGAIIIPGTPQDLGAMVARDIVRLGQVVKDSGAKPE
ncbi:MAG: tripartite tricarboxylate transporter substrate binding protein [Xanthobacteraceae bacterium]|nr:tripartite tricarboxylate transporter substrate binding protein [Xanthobacteraceae bacterium]